MKTLCVNSHTKDANEIKLDLVDRPMPSLNKNECLIKVVSSGVNPSDALAVMGYFNKAILPRVPGRDFSGIVIDGPGHLVGKNVWGSGGAAGISSDGTQAEYIKLSAEDISESPNTFDALIAGAQPLPYITAYYSLVKRGHIEENETVLVVGALGSVGSAAMSICNWKKCNAIALVLGKKEMEKSAAYGWNAINSEDGNLSEKVRAANNGHPVQMILNSVGNIYWQDFMTVLSEFGRIVTISARENQRDAIINLFNLYRANQDIIGVNTLPLGFNQNAKLLNELKTGFEEKKLTPLALEQAMIYAPENASEAYKEVVQGHSGKRVAIQFTKEQKTS